MQPQSVYNLEIQGDESRTRRSRVGLLHQKTGVPVFLLYLVDIKEVCTYELFSMEEVETLRYKTLSKSDQEAWRLVKTFFESEGQHAHVVASPLSTKNPLKSMLGEDKGLDFRSGIHALRAYVEHADLVVAPQASHILEDREHRRFFSKLFELNTELDHFFVLVDFPKNFDLDRLNKWKKGLQHANAALYFPWLLGNECITSPSPVAAAAYQQNDVQYGIQDSPANRSLPTGYRPLRLFSPMELQQLNGAGLNVLNIFGESDLRIWGDYTLTDKLDFDNKHVATRRTLLALREAINQICEPFVLEPIGPDLAHTIEVSLHSFFQDNQKLLDTTTRQPFKTEVSIENRGGDDVVEITLQLCLPYVVNQMSLSMAVTG